MKTPPHFELVSFDICPYVQRSVITLLHKEVPFKLTFIDLASPPEWFTKISPLGKVPLLLVRENHSNENVVLFESAVINMYVDEVTPPALAPKDPLKKARERAWVEVGAELLMKMYPMMISSDAAEIEAARKELWEIFDHVERALPGGSTFRGEEFSLVDAAFAPVFMRLLMFKPLLDDRAWSTHPKTLRWAEALLARPEVLSSVIPEFKEKTRHYLKEHGALWANELI